MYTYTQAHIHYLFFEGMPLNLVFLRARAHTRTHTHPLSLSLSLRQTLLKWFEVLNVLLNRKPGPGPD